MGATNRPEGRRRATKNGPGSARPLTRRARPETLAPRRAMGKVPPPPPGARATSRRRAVTPADAARKPRPLEPLSAHEALRARLRCLLRCRRLWRRWPPGRSRERTAARRAVRPGLRRLRSGAGLLRARLRGRARVRRRLFCPVQGRGRLRRRLGVHEGLGRPLLGTGLRRLRGGSRALPAGAEHACALSPPGTRWASARGLFGIPRASSVTAEEAHDAASGSPRHGRPWAEASANLANIS